MNNVQTCRRIVSDILCPPGSRPADVEVCSDFSVCSFVWQPLSWNACSNTCGTGTRERQVDCIRTDSSQTRVSSDMCLDIKPAVSEACADASGCDYSLVDECATDSHACSAHATCQDTYGSFICTCQQGFVGSGNVCSDIDECLLGTAVCGPQADCVNTFGSFVCVCEAGLYQEANGVCVACPNGASTPSAGAVSVAECTSCAPGLYGAPATVGGTGCSPCPEGSTSAPGSTTIADCFCSFGYTDQTGSNSSSCVLSFADVGALSGFADLGNPGESCDEVCAATGRQCMSELLDGVRSELDMNQALSSLGISMERAFGPARRDMFTGLHAHYKVRPASLPLLSAVAEEGAAGLDEDSEHRLRTGTPTPASGRMLQAIPGMVTHEGRHLSFGLPHAATVAVVAWRLKSTTHGEQSATTIGTIEMRV